MGTAGKDNLTRDEARGRARILSNLSYDIALDLRGDSTFASETTVRFDCSEPGAATFIDLDAVDVHDVSLNGRKLEVTGTPDGRFSLDGLDHTNELTVTATCEYSRTGTGLHRTVDPVDKRAYTYTQFEPFDAHRVFACFDQPDLKATFTFDIEVPEEWVVVSNMRPSSRPEEGQAGRWRFAATPKMSTYLAAICAGPYEGVFESVEHDGRTVDLGWWCRRSLMTYLDPDELFDITKRGFAFFLEMFDYPYMLDSYDQVFCPEYKFGAMENLGCVTYSERMVFRSKVTEAERERRAEVILHEMSHMWFGDLVTMRWWDDLWLNESFATYMAYLAKERATRFTNAWVTFASGEKTWAYRQDQLPTTHPIVADIPDVDATHLNFDGITYAKGASVLKQLVAWVGEGAFFKGLRRYFKEHAYGNTELSDFLAPLAEESGRDLDTWSSEWLETAGVNAIRIDHELDGDRMKRPTVVQEAKPSHPTLRPHRMAIGLFDLTPEGLELRRSLELDVVGAATEIEDLNGEQVPDLLLPNHMDLAYTKIRFDERSLQTLSDRLRDLDDPLARILCWGAAWDMVRDAELPAGRYLDLVLNNIDGESDIGVTLSLIGHMSSSIDVYGSPQARDPRREKLAGAARSRMNAAEPGSDVQLAWARAFISAARSDEELGSVRELLEGTGSVPGLVVDTDLRWLIVGALAAAGAIDDGVIAAELERDPTDQGERHAASARAARPTPDAKEEAWTRLVDDPGISLAMLRSIAGGFQDPAREDLLAPYADRYFQDVLDFWHKRPLDLGLAFAGGLYPRTYSEDVAERTDVLLAREDIPVPVRRILLEGEDDTRRVMRARASDSPC